MKPKTVRAIHRRIAIATRVFMVGGFVLAGMMLLPTLLGFERYVIVSGSMEPTLPVGSVVYDEVVPVEDLRVGDIITFLPPPEYDIHDPVTHRIVAITTIEEGSSAGARMLTTKGDANDKVDDWRMVPDGPEQARVKRYIPYVGYIYMALQRTWVQVLVIGVPAAALIAYVLVTLWRVSGEAVQRERIEKAQAADPEPEPSSEVQR